MQITQIASNDQDPDGFEHLWWFDDGAVAAGSEKSIVLRRSGASTPEQLCYKSVPTGPYGDLLNAAFEHGSPVAERPMTADDVRLWLGLYGPHASIPRSDGYHRLRDGREVVEPYDAV